VEPAGDLPRVLPVIHPRPATFLAAPRGLQRLQLVIISASSAPTRVMTITVRAGDSAWSTPFSRAPAHPAPAPRSCCQIRHAICHRAAAAVPPPADKCRPHERVLLLDFSAEASFAAVVVFPIPVTRRGKLPSTTEAYSRPPWYRQAAWRFIVHQLDDCWPGTDGSPGASTPVAHSLATARHLEAHVRLEQVAADLAQRVSYIAFRQHPRP